MAEIDRSTEDIRMDLAKEEENLSQNFEEIGERIKEKLNWREYVREYPYMVLGAAAGLGYFASRALPRRTTPMERIMNSIVWEVRHSINDLHSKSVSPGMIKGAMLGMATKVASGLIKNATSIALTNSRSKRK